MNTTIKVSMTAKLNGSKFINQGPSVWQRRLTSLTILSKLCNKQHDDFIQIH